MIAIPLGILKRQGSDLPLVFYVLIYVSILFVCTPRLRNRKLLRGEWVFGMKKIWRQITSAQSLPCLCNIIPNASHLCRSAPGKPEWKACTLLWEQSIPLHVFSWIHLGQLISISQRIPGKSQCRGISLTLLLSCIPRSTACLKRDRRSKSLWSHLRSHVSLQTSVEMAVV